MVNRQGEFHCDVDKIESSGWGFGTGLQFVTPPTTVPPYEESAALRLG